MNRRSVVLGIGIFLGASTRSSGQGAFPAINVPAFSDSLARPGALEEIFIDVSFVHSWRAILSPRGYEGEPQWLQGANTNRIRLFEAIGQGRASAKIMQASEFVAAYDKIATESYEKNRSDFDKFLGDDLQVSPDGKAGLRIKESLRSYTLLNAAALPDQIQENEKSSYFFPFC